MLPILSLPWNGMQNCQVSEAIARDKHGEVSEKIGTVWLGQSHLLVWVAKDLSFMTDFNFGWESVLVKIVLGRFMLFVLCHYTAIFAKASYN